MSEPQHCFNVHDASVPESFAEPPAFDATAKTNTQRETKFDIYHQK